MLRSRSSCIVDRVTSGRVEIRFWFIVGLVDVVLTGAVAS